MYRNNFPEEFFLVFFIIFFLVIAVSYLVFSLFLLTLNNTLNQVSEERRAIPTGQLWLSLIPVFSYVWLFIVVNRMTDSLRSEFESRGMPLPSDNFGKDIGIAFCILFCCGILPYIGSLAGLAGLICWIIYWVKMHGYKTDLMRYQTADTDVF